MPWHPQGPVSSTPTLKVLKRYMDVQDNYPPHNAPSSHPPLLTHKPHVYPLSSGNISSCAQNMYMSLSQI